MITWGTPSITESSVLLQLHGFSGTCSLGGKGYTVKELDWNREEGACALWVSVTEHGFCHRNTCFCWIASILLFTGTEFINMNGQSQEPSSAALINFFSEILNPKSDFSNCYLDHLCWHQTIWIIHNNGANQILKTLVTPCSCLITGKQY